MAHFLPGATEALVPTRGARGWEEEEHEEGGGGQYSTDLLRAAIGRLPPPSRRPPCTFRQRQGNSSQAFCSCSQHHACLDADHPARQLEKPASQSYGADVVDSVTTQALCSFVQHQLFLYSDQPARQLSKPASQSKGFEDTGTGATGAGVSGGSVGCTTTGTIRVS